MPTHKRKTEGGPRRPGGPPQPMPSELRTRRVNVDVSPAEWATLTSRPEAVRLGVRRYMREAALGQLSTPETAPPSQADFDAAALLTRLAGDLSRLADAAAAGIISDVAPDLLRDLCTAAHLLGLRLIGAHAGVR